jgi:hypothetical protein
MAASKSASSIGQTDRSSPTGTNLLENREDRARHLRGGALSGLSVLSANDIWAVGDHLIARYAC